MPAYFAYYRVSTQKQGNSGLGLEAQRAAVTRFLQKAAPVEEYVEVESGQKNQRPQLLAAIAASSWGRWGGVAHCQAGPAFQECGVYPDPA